MTTHRLLTVVFAVMSLLAAACSGGDDDPGGATGDAGGASDDSGADGADAGDGSEDGSDDTGGDTGDAGGDTGNDGDDSASTGSAVEGPVYLVSGLGAIAVSPDGSDAEQITFADVDGVSIGTEPVTDGEGAYVVVFRTLEGQSFAAEAFVGRIDLATGETSIVGRLGVDRESDEADELTEYGPMVAIDGDVWVYAQVFGETTGELLRLGADQPDGPVDSLTLSRPADLHTDGQRIYAWTSSGLLVVDPATGATEVLVTDGVALTDLVPDVDVTPLIVTRSGAALDDEALAVVADNVSFFSGSIDGTALVDGTFWVTVGEILQTSPETVLFEAAVGFDVDDGSVSSIVGTVGDGTYFVDESTVDVGDGAVAGFDGALWIVDRQANGRVLRVDPAAGTAEPVHDPCEAPIECEQNRFVLTDPDALWLEVTRYERTDESSRVGSIHLERIDPVTGEVVASASVESLIF